MVYRKSEKRENLKKANRDKIVKAAITIFGNDGLDTANVREIIKVSGVSAGSFYSFFKNKEEVFNYILDNILVDLRDTGRQLWREAFGGQRSFESGFEEFFKAIRSNPEYMRFMARNQAHIRNLRYEGRITPFLQSLEEDIEHSVREKNLPPVPVKFLTVVIFGMVFEYIADMVVTPEKVDIHEVSVNLSGFIRGGLMLLALEKGARNISAQILSVLGLKNTFFLPGMKK